MKGSKYFFKNFSFLSFGLFVCFLAPYFILFKYFSPKFSIATEEIFFALKNSTWQAGVAAFVVTILSIPMSQGLLTLGQRTRSWVEKLLMLPQIFPALYSILIVFSLVNPFPMGTYGIIVVFCVINLGFATLLNLWSTENKLGRMALISEVYGLGRWRFFTRVYFPALKTDLWVNFFIIFIFCFSSFSVPLMVGGGRGLNLEVLIYEKIFVEHNWNMAVTLGFLQTLLIFFLSVMIFREQRRPQEVFIRGRYLKSFTGLILVVVYLLLYIGGYLRGVGTSLAQVPFLFMYTWDLAAATAFTLKTVLLFLVMNGVLLVLWVLDFIQRGRFNSAVHMLSVSTVVTGFAFYLIFPVRAEFDQTKIIFGMSVLLFPALFKLFLQKPIENLSHQINVAKALGLSKRVIITEVVFRQIRTRLLAWASFLVLWLSSDYAIVKSLGIQTQTLGMISAGFLSSYRLALSYLISFYILVFWVLVMILVYSAAKVIYVVYKKFAL